MSRDRAIEQLRQELDLEALNSNVVLQFGDLSWELPLYRIGAYVDLNESVDQALGLADQVPFYERWLKRFTFQSMDEDVDLVVATSRASFLLSSRSCGHPSTASR